MSILERIDKEQIKSIIEIQKRILENQASLGILLTECSRELSNNSFKIVKILNVLENYIELYEKFSKTDLRYGEYLQIDGWTYKRLPKHEDYSRKLLKGWKEENARNSHSQKETLVEE